MQGSLSVISPELIPIHERLVNIRRRLVALMARDKLKQTEFKPLLEELRKIDSLSLFTVNCVRNLQLIGPLPVKNYTAPSFGSLNNLHS